MMERYSEIEKKWLKPITAALCFYEFLAILTENRLPRQRQLPTITRGLKYLRNHWWGKPLLWCGLGWFGAHVWVDLQNFLEEN